MKLAEHLVAKYGTALAAATIAVAVIGAASCARAETNVHLLIVHPARWEAPVTNFAASKARLGLDVTNVPLESVCDTNNTAYPELREYLSNYLTSAVPAGYSLNVLFVGDFQTIPAPAFRVLTGDGATYRSDIYYRDLDTEFDRDGDEIFGEYDGSGTAQDFDIFSFAAAFGGISSSLVLGRIPVCASGSAAELAAILERSVAFEREVSARKDRILMTAGRIDTVAHPADSWEFVVKEVAGLVTGTCPFKVVTTVAHVGTDYVDRAGIDYVVEGANIAADYVTGQNLVRGLVESNNYAFLCNVSHGGPNSDFALTRLGAGLPTNAGPMVIVSMSCASYELGAAAVTSGVAVGYVGSTAVVTPDVMTLLSGTNMVSGDAQRLAVLRLLRDGYSAGATFADGFDYYLAEIMAPRAASFFMLNKPDILRNVIGFQLIGDPSLVLAYADGDADGLLDVEESVLGTLPDDPDTDDDLMSDGDEVIAGTAPLDPASVAAIVAIECWATGAAATVRWPSVKGRTYRVERSISLIPTDWTECSEPMGGTDGVLSFAETNAAVSGAVYRIRIRK